MIKQLLAATLISVSSLAIAQSSSEKNSCFDTKLVVDTLKLNVQNFFD
jgi:hypothetical protein